MNELESALARIEGREFDDAPPVLAGARIQFESYQAIIITLTKALRVAVAALGGDEK